MFVSSASVVGSMADPTSADVVCNQAAMQSSISEVKQHQFKAVMSASRALANTRFTLNSSQCIRMTNDQVNLLLCEKLCFFFKKKWLFLVGGGRCDSVV